MLILNLLKKKQPPEFHKIKIKTSLTECISDDWDEMNTKYRIYTNKSLMFAFILRDYSVKVSHY